MSKKILRSITLADIAKLSGVSEASVSAVLNGSRSIHVSAATRERILTSARQLNYIRPIVKPSLPGAGFIGIIGTAAFLPLPQYTSIIQGNLLSHGYDSVVAGRSLITLNQVHGAYTSPESMVSMGAQGLIFLTDNFPWERAVSLSVPFVIFGQDSRNCDIFFNKFRGYRIMLEHLREVHGKRRPLFVSVHNAWDSAQVQRQIKSVNGDYLSLWDLDGDADRLFEEVARRKCDILALSNDHLACKIIKAALQRGIRVPEDLAIIGFDGTTSSEDAAVTLTTAMQPIRETSEQICELLYDRFAGRRMERQKMEMPLLVHYGHSCGCPERKINRLFTRNTFSLLEIDAQENFNGQLEDCVRYPAGEKTSS